MRGKGRDVTGTDADDQAEARELYAGWLRQAGYAVQAVPDGTACLAAMAANDTAAVVLDLKMPPGEFGGLETLAALRRDYPQVPVIILSSLADVKRAVACVRLGAFDFVDKQTARDGLPVSLANALRLGELERAAERLSEENRLLRAEQRQGLGPMLGSSPAMQAVYRLIERVAPTDATVLISGETGTGKELAAQSLHDRSALREGPMIKVNCAALPEALLEAELFGHEKGAFTGAHERRLGRLELADGGTLFLDEVGDLAPATQAKLLRALQEREFERVGGARTIKVSVRVIAATNQDLRAKLAAGAFREDLFYRLHEVDLRLPPLREHREDIPELAEHFVTGFGGAYQGKRLAPETVRALMGHDWPGNVRELKGTLKSACILATGETVSPADLPPGLAETGNLPAGWIGTLAELEQAAILQAMAACDGNVAAAARRLGLSWQSLWRRLRKHGLVPAPDTHAAATLAGGDD